MQNRGIAVYRAAKRLKIKHSYFYGVMLAYGVRPVTVKGWHKKGRPPKLIDRKQYRLIKARLREADRNPIMAST